MTSPQHKPSSPPAPQPMLTLRPLSARMRWLNIGVRTLHIAVTGILFGGMTFALDFSRLGPWHLLTILSGLSLLSLEWWHDHYWWHRGKGLLVLFHLALCLLVHWLGRFTLPVVWLILISGCIGSHMPRRYRHWSIRDGWEKKTPRP